MNLEKASIKDQGNKVVRVKANEQKNTVAAILNFTGWLTILLCVITFASNGFSLLNLLSIPYIIYGVLSGFLLIGFSEIINLLQKIYINTKKD